MSASRSSTSAHAGSSIDSGQCPHRLRHSSNSLRVRLLAAAAGALGVETERGRGVVIRLTLDHGLDLASVAAQFRGITATPSQLHLGDAWQTTLTPVLRELGRLSRAQQRVPVAAQNAHA